MESACNRALSAKWKVLCNGTWHRIPRFLPSCLLYSSLLSHLLQDKVGWEWRKMYTSMFVFVCEREPDRERGLDMLCGNFEHQFFKQSILRVSWMSSQRCGSSIEAEHMQWYKLLRGNDQQYVSKIKLCQSVQEEKLQQMHWGVKTITFFWIEHKIKSMHQ